MIAIVTSTSMTTQRFFNMTCLATGDIRAKGAGSGIC